MAAAARNAVSRWPAELETLDELAADGWPVLSVGAAPSGLAPHAHGFSYIVLLRGHKRWAMYAPDAGLPEPARAALPPPLLRSNATSVLETLRGLSGAARPTICTQRSLALGHIWTTFPVLSAPCSPQTRQVPCSD